MKNLKFADNLVPLIIEGSKTATWRIYDDKKLQTGDELNFINMQGLKSFGTAVITNIKIKTLDNIVDSDFDSHEKFPDKQTMIETYKGYYGDTVDKNTEVKIIDFKFTAN